MNEIGCIFSIKKLEKASVEVKIPKDEVDRLIVKRLIGIRNHPTNSKYTEHLDKIIKGFFLSEEEFKDYVINRKRIE